MNFLTSIFLGTSLILAYSLLSCTNSTEPHRKPNVIIILTDDQAWGDLSANGNTNLSTPNIDRLASQGATFDNFYVCAVCSPTRAELLTGRYSFRSGIYSTGGGGERMDTDETTMAEIFKEAGYATAAYGKWHNGMQYPYHPNARGFDDFYGFCSGHWGNYFSPMLEHNGEVVQGDGFLIDDFTNHGLEFMENNRDQPFFLYLPFNTPHTPFQAPERNWENFKTREIEMLSETGEEKLTETRAALAMVENIDENVGRVLSKTEELGIAENTIVLFFSDNGPAVWRWNGGMRGKKGSTDEGGIRSPLIVKWPNRVRPGKTIERLAAVTDLLPTLSEMCGIDHLPPKDLDGISLKGTIIGEEAHWEDRYVFSSWKDQASVRNQKYRLSARNELHDIESDRQQKWDLSSKFPEIKAELQEVADGYLEQKRLELPTVDNRPFYLGHPAMRFTQIPARDGKPHGGIERSNKYPNCSFFTNWKSVNDSISWNVEVPETGRFKVSLYYTCPLGDEGSMIELSLDSDRLIGTINEPHDPPLRGIEEDLSPRIESYVKDWKVVEIGTIDLKAGKGDLTLKAIEIPGKSVMDFRLLLFERLD